MLQQQQMLLPNVATATDVAEGTCVAIVSDVATATAVATSTLAVIIK